MSAAVSISSSPVVPPEGEKRRAIADVERFLSQRPHDGQVRLVADGVEVVMPPLLTDVLGQLAAILGRGDGIVVSPVTPELSTTEAARMLRMSRPTLVRLLDTGEIPSRKVGTHRRIATSEILTYRQKMIKEQLGAYEDLMRHLDDEGITEG